MGSGKSFYEAWSHPSIADGGCSRDRSRHHDCGLMPLPDTAIEREQARALQLFAQLYCCREVQLLSMPPRAAEAAAAGTGINCDSRRCWRSSFRRISFSKKQLGLYRDLQGI